MTNRKVVSLFSGGIDSTVMTCQLLAEGEEVLPLFVNYGQITASQERASIDSLTRKLRLPAFADVDVSGIGKWGSGSLTGDNTTECFYNRNLFLITVASIVAARTSAQAVAIGIICADNPEFLDCSWNFIKQAQTSLHAGDFSLDLLTPLAHLGKYEVIQKGVDLGIDIDLTYSCNVRPDRHCLLCNSCLERFRFESVWLQT